MRCPDCGYEVPEPLSLCPRCGLNVAETQPIKRRRARRDRRGTAMEETIPLLIPSPEERPRRAVTFWRRLRVVLMGFGAFLCLLALAVVVAGYAGVREGEQERARQRIALADEHYRRGLARLDSGEYELAIAEFEYALRLDPNHTLAAQGLAEAQVRLATRPTPTLQATEDIAHDLYRRGAAAYQQQDWAAAARLLSQLRAFAPDYETEAVEEMLFASLYNQGLSCLTEGSLEEGIFYLDRAQQIRPLDDEALLQLELARRYMAVLGFWGVDWPLCIEKLEALYAVAPHYRDVFTRLFQAHVLYGDLQSAQGELCPAAAQYAQALELMNDSEVVQKRNQAVEICAVATPTPIPPITGTLPTTGTLVVPDFRVGRLTYPAYNPQTGLYDVYAVTSDGSNGLLTRVAAGADQPCWGWGGDRLIYRDRLLGGISLIQSGGEPTTLLTDRAAAWPTLSPDGGRYAYATPDGAGVWHIYIARTDGTGQPVVHAPGWGPAWGPAGLLAWTGCEADGSACGIFVDHPDDDQPPRRLTANINDTGLHWVPSGDLIVYMSDHTGNWDLYLLSTTGAVQALTDDPLSEGLPAWAPDGSAVAFLSYRDGRWGLYLMQTSGQNVRQIIDLGTEMPNWQSQRLCWAPS